MHDLHDHDASPRHQTPHDLEQLGISVIRGLAMDGPRQAGSGHPGTAMALAPLAHVLWTRIMRYDAADPHWPDRDRFVLSVGHAGMLLYSMLYLTGYDIDLNDLRTTRRLGSKAPGHPEAGLVPGVEVTTGPLGQGLANAVGLALAERMLRARYGPGLFDHFTFVICGDGDLMEGISHEAASLAGALGLGRLICIYDDNHVSIDGPTEITLQDDTVQRFASYGWHTADLGEAANDLDTLEDAIRHAMAVDDRPSLLQLRSHIGWPAPHLTDSPKAHGAPFPPEEIRATKRLLGIPPDEQFWVPDQVLDFYRAAGRRGAARRDDWNDRLTGSLDAAGLDQATWGRLWQAEPSPDLEALLPHWAAGEAVSTRSALNTCLNRARPAVPALVSGAADLTGNTGTRLEGEPRQGPSSPEGRLIAYGVREHAMGGVMNGMAAHGGVLPVGGTFFVFSDYMRPSVRLAALSHTKVVYSWTHDSIALGEDGPTHQPVEQLAAMRAMPGLLVIRPADANETAQAVRVALNHDGPTALILSRQTIPVLPLGPDRTRMLERGAYTVTEPGNRRPDITLIGTGAEVSLCLDAARLLGQHGITARVVSMPSWGLFEDQPDSYRQAVLPGDAPTLAVEAASSLGWHRWADDSVSLDQFGASGPGPDVLAHFGFTAENVAQRARNLITAASRHDQPKPASR